MPQQTISDGETGLSVRTKINENFAEAYTGAAYIDALLGYQILAEDFVVGSNFDPNGWNTSDLNTGAVAAFGAGSVKAWEALGGLNDGFVFMGSSACLALAAGKTAEAHFRIKVERGEGGTIGNQTIFVGMISDAFDLSTTASLTDDNVIGFWSATGTVNIDCVCRASDAQSQVAEAATYAENTWMKLSFVYDGTAVAFYKDNAAIGTVSTNIPTSGMFPIFYMRAGEAAPCKFSADYCFVRIER